MDRILNMIFRRVIGRLMNRGIDAGISRMSRGNAGEATPAQQAQTRQTAQRTKQAMRMARRIGRF
ncbi:hypothetical protein [Roseicyclus mahoneyensis]|uniref:Uncharacterized protein n=1 Tax=Roseicyclus mahoneyensis TaxID=164332 RepID=A0A316GJN7_9RHOB|nr:hypothetical protein [Roseicyclus mahoneyensis]PWK61132.1 hypothetical protein C7455_103332 [Roseicyclus mahoneyensis]